MSFRHFWTILHEHIDLSKYEAKVYTSLIMHGPNSAGRLSIICGVPRTKIYSVLKKLMERGLIYEAPTKPRTFYAFSPVDVLGDFVHYYEDVTRELKEVLFTLNEFHVKNRSKKMVRKTIWILRGRDIIIRKIREMISHAKEKVDIIVTDKELLPFYKLFNRLLDKIVAKGVKITLKIPIRDDSLLFLRELNYICEIKKLIRTPSIIFVKVDDEMIIADRASIDHRLNPKSETAVYIKDAFLGRIFSLIFSLLEEKRK